MHIKIKKGLDIPLRGKPHKSLEELPLPKRVALDLNPFGEKRFNLLVKVGDQVVLGQLLAEDKALPGRVFVSPASGKFVEIVRGLKRRILSLVIETNSDGQLFTHEKDLLTGGLYGQLRMRPYNRLANPEKMPKCIFVKAIESAPFAPPPELELQGFEDEFQFGLSTLSKIAPVHLVCRDPFPNFQDVNVHTADGPHPVGNVSIHISAIEPLLSSEDCLWTLTVHDVICVGKLLQSGQVHSTRVISIAGEGIREELRGFYRVNKGISIEALVQDRLCEGEFRLISGGPLLGDKVEPSGFLGAYHNVFCAIPEGPPKREFLHFLRLGLKKYTASRTYIGSGDKDYSFDTNQHGEVRAFVDGSIYDKVMPLPISVEHLIKAILAEDFEKAEQLGFLEIAEEDFALPAFICPSKIDMVGIVKRGLDTYASQYGI